MFVNALQLQNKDRAWHMSHDQQDGDITLIVENEQHTLDTSPGTFQTLAILQFDLIHLE